MASTVPATAQEAQMRLLQDIAVAMAAPDADLDHLAEMQKMVVAQIRQPYDTPSPGSPAAGGSAVNLSAGAGPPDLTAGSVPPGPPMPGGPSPSLIGPQGGGISPMMQALVGQSAGGGGAGPLPPGSYQPGGLATRTPPNMDELRRILTMGPGQ